MMLNWINLLPIFTFYFNIADKMIYAFFFPNVLNIGLDFSFPPFMRSVKQVKDWTKHIDLFIFIVFHYQILTYFA